jgi:hypothetical protein
MLCGTRPWGLQCDGVWSDGVLVGAHLGLVGRKVEAEARQRPAACRGGQWRMATD